MGPAGRFVGVDAARGLAIMGMLWAHVAPDGTQNGLADGRSSVLFATVAGMSLGFITGGPRPPEGDARRRAARSVLLRGLWLVALGLLLWALGTPVHVILDEYGVLFVVLVPLLFARRAVLVGVAAVCATLGAFAAVTVGERAALPLSPAAIGHLAGDWFVSGSYPVVVFGAYVLAGLVAARSDLGRRRTQVALVVIGSALSVAGYASAGMFGQDASAHSDTTFEVLGSGGLALAIVGALQLAATVPAVRTLLVPLSTPGAMPLTIYTGQIFVLAVWLLTPAAGSPPWIASWPLLVGLVAGSIAFALVWRRWVGKGPMEAALAAVTATAPRTEGALR